MDISTPANAPGLSALWEIRHGERIRLAALLFTLPPVAAMSGGPLARALALGWGGLVVGRLAVDPIEGDPSSGEADDLARLLGARQALTAPPGLHCPDGGAKQVGELCVAELSDQLGQ
jgi:hypothetical protein